LVSIDCQRKEAEMRTTITLDEAAQQLRTLLRQLSLGDTVTLTEANGAPIAVLIGLSPTASSPPVSDWSQRWRRLAAQIDRAWQTEQSALQILTEMRR
jgi:antitoxin (DNA-binding transcriptional repressor) of toxin-antitoxin stability system